MVKKKILLLIPNLGVGGAQRVFSEQSIQFSEWHEVVECAFNLDSSPAYPTNSLSVSLNVPAGNSIATKAKYFLKRCWRLRQIKKKEQPDVTISHMEGANYINVLSRGKDKKILVIHGSKTAPDSNYTGFLDWVQRRILIPYLLKLADCIVPVSEGIKHELSDTYGIPSSKITVIKNSFDIEKIQLQAKESLLLKFEVLYDKPTIISCGRLANQKNPLALLKVFSVIKKQYNCRLLLIGDGHLKETLIEQAVAEGLKVYDNTSNQAKLQEADSSDVIIVGFWSNPFQFVRNANLFVMSSDFEGFPLALAEAMICGTPAISTDCPTGPRELLAPGTDVTYQTTEPEETPYGWLMPLLKDQAVIDQWAQMIVQLLNKPELTKVKATAAQQRMEEFSQEKIVRQWFDLIGK